MKDKERFISIDDSGESIFTFDEADMIIDTKTNIVYGANNIPDLVKILNSQSLQWQKLKEHISNQIIHYDELSDKFKEENNNGCVLLANSKRSMIEEILYKMQELEQELAELKEKAIVPRFRRQEIVYCFSYGKIQLFNVFAYLDNQITLCENRETGKLEFVNNDYLCINEQEAQAKLKEMKGNE